MVETRARPHVLSFEVAAKDVCHLTLLHNGIRFHLKVQADRVQDEEDDRLYTKFMELLAAVRDLEDVEHDSSATEENKISEKSESSSHAPSRKRKRDDKDGEDYEDKTQSSGRAGDQKRFHDSALGTPESPTASTNPAMDLQNWLIQPFHSIFSERASRADKPSSLSLHDWYHSPAYFYTLEAKDNQLLAVELTNDDHSTDLKSQVPQLSSVPKYINSLSTPWYSSHALTVLSESDEIAPFHPVRVSLEDSSTKQESIRFLKLVDNANIAPIKREIKVLTTIEKKGLHKKFNVPIIEGFVTDNKSPDSRGSLMGIMLTEIPNPTPLTHLLDSDVPQKKRERWAAESQRIVDLLHENDIIWGDAKADNFMVDKNDKLWIIDFGGSYTPGWIDEELNETVEGDEMGLEKVVNALENPDNATIDPDEARDDHFEAETDDDDAGLHEEPLEEVKKRKRTDEANGEESYPTPRDTPRKKVRH